jgi:hypothetical protein
MYFVFHVLSCDILLVLKNIDQKELMYCFAMLMGHFDLKNVVDRLPCFYC